MLQGVLIGVVGSAIGLVVGLYALLLRRQIPLDPAGRTVYSLSFVPFEPRWLDGVWIAAAAILVSFLATIYPARQAPPGSRPPRSCGTNRALTATA